MRKWEHGTYSGGSVIAHNTISTYPLYHPWWKWIQCPKCCILFGIMDDGKVQKAITLRVLPPHLTSCCPLYMENPRFPSSSSGCIVGFWNECRSFLVCRATCFFSLQPQYTDITEQRQARHLNLTLYPPIMPPGHYLLLTLPLWLTNKKSLKWLQCKTARKFCRAFTHIRKKTNSLHFNTQEAEFTNMVFIKDREHLCQLNSYWLLYWVSCKICNWLTALLYVCTAINMKCVWSVLNRPLCIALTS
jgi:hypothetical protein